MKRHTIIAALLICATVPLFGQAPAATSLSANEVMARVIERDGQRESLGGGYSGKREYVLYNHRMNKRARDGGERCLRCERGKAVSGRFRRRMEVGQQACAAQDAGLGIGDISTRYPPQDTDGSGQLRVSPESGPTIFRVDLPMSLTRVPKRSDKYLFRGRVWVDAEDFAVARVEGQPAKSPSFWTRSVHFAQQYHKSGIFLVSGRNHQLHRSA